jgi:DNA-binding transcriptional regulator LsrR (DeoR family)
MGRAVRALVEGLSRQPVRQVICVPIIGGPSGKLESRSREHADLRRGGKA